ncbi:MAG: hypothetical protein GX307_04020 [Euryarchaeota archaeon]|nr:hypothetical protein [Euryarchaeota archaeon]
MDAQTLLLVISASIFIGFLANYMFLRYRAPDVLVLIFFGMLLGPGALGIIDQNMANQIGQVSTYVAAVALSIIMLQAGMGLKIRVVLTTFNKALILTLVAFVVSIVFTTIIGVTSMGWGLGESMLLGSILGGTSGAIVIPLVNALDVSGNVKTMLIVESAVTDVLVIAVAMAIIAVLASGSTNLAEVTIDTISAFLVSGIIGLLGGLAWLKILSLTTGQPFPYMITLAFMLLIFALSDLMVGSGGGAIAALAFGLTLGNSNELPQVIRRQVGYSCESKIIDFHDEISFFVRTFFFIYLGLVLSTVALAPVDILAGVVIFNMIVLGRMAVTGSLGRWLCKNRKDRLTLLFMLPRGLSAAVMASLPLSLGAVGGEVGNMIGGITAVVILLTTCFASIGAYVIEKYGGRSESAHESSHEAPGTY